VIISYKGLTYFETWFPESSCNYETDLPTPYELEVTGSEGIQDHLISGIWVLQNGTQRAQSGYQRKRNDT